MVQRTFIGKLLTTLSLGVVITLCLVLQVNFVQAERAPDILGVEAVVSQNGVYKALPYGQSSSGLDNGSRETSVESHSRAASNKLRTNDPNGNNLLATIWGGSFHSTHTKPVSPFKAQVLGRSYLILIRSLRI
jgi:hypothetical protein